MSTQLYIPNEKKTISDFSEIQGYLAERGVELTRWKAQFNLLDTDDQETILKAYEHELKPYMERKGFKSADVINVHNKTENLQAIREKFLSEHTHSEDEVRFFVDGEGQFWFHFDNGEVAAITCVRGDFLSVPQGIKHWFDLAPKYFVKAIRIFTNTEGWVAKYTGSGVDQKYREGVLQ